MYDNQIHVGSLLVGSDWHHTNKINYYTMKKALIFLILLFALSVTGCDKDECAICHECECVCPV
jgi:hypothetical protein